MSDLSDFKRHVYQPLLAERDALVTETRRLRDALEAYFRAPHAEALIGEYREWDVRVTEAEREAARVALNGTP